MFYPSFSRGFSSNINNSLAQTDASYARSDARDAKNEADILRQDVDRLLMITEALWSFMKKEHGYTDDQLADAIKDIDLRDGRVDGKAQAPAPAPCPNCGKVNSAHRTRCIYCGQELPVALFGS